MNNIIKNIVIICLLGVILYGLYNYKQGYSNTNIEKYQKTIDSLAIEISKKDKVIGSLDSTRCVLDSLLVLDKAKLANIAKKAQQYKDQYEKERNRFNTMSDDDIISTFTTTFK
jgi:uncharacterized membrane protein